MIHWLLRQSAPRLPNQGVAIIACSMIVLVFGTFFMKGIHAQTADFGVTIQVIEGNICTSDERDLGILTTVPNPTYQWSLEGKGQLLNLPGSRDNKYKAPDTPANDIVTVIVTADTKFDLDSANLSVISCNCIDQGSVITEPRDDQPVSGPVTVMGIANRTNFKEYSIDLARLTYSAEASAPKWINLGGIISGTQPILNNGVLGVWDSTTVAADGIFRLTLVVKDSNGNFIYPCSKTIRVNNTGGTIPPTPTPMPTTAPASPDAPIPTSAPTPTSAPVASPSNGPVADSLTVIGETNVRAGPSTTYCKIASKFPGDQLDFGHKNSDTSWYRLKEGGWIKGERLDKAPKDSASLPVFEIAQDIAGAFKARGGATLRSYPNPAKKAVGLIPEAGGEVNILSEWAGWFQLANGSWISGTELTTVPVNVLKCSDDLVAEEYEPPG